jgi:hypothetical protein
MKFLTKTLFICTAIFAFSANARTPVPVINYENVTIATASGKSLQIEQVKQAISSAAASKGWTVAYSTDGSLLATLVVRNKHTVVVKIDYDVSKYSINYNDSNNMKYGIINVQPTIASSNQDQSHNGQAEIHPFYNKWVQDLKGAIGSELLKL